jgi:hypothetical protein
MKLCEYIPWYMWRQLVTEGTEIGFPQPGVTDKIAAMPCATGCYIYEHGLWCSLCLQAEKNQS